MNVDAIVLAGGKNDAEMIAATGVENRALVELAAGRTMLDFVVAALSSAQTVGRIFIVGDVPVRADTDRGADPLVGGRALLVTSDIPFITADAVDDFVVRAARRPADLCYPIVPMADYDTQFAGMKRTTLKLAEGRFTGGNIMLCDPVRILANRETMARSYAARKDVLALGRMLGWGFVARIILSQTIAPAFLDVAKVEIAVGRVLGPGGTAAAIITRHPSLGTDVDKPEDVEFARRRLAGAPLPRREGNRNDP